MARPRKPSDDINNIRKRAKRRIKMLNESGYEENARELQKLLDSTYRKTGASARELSYNTRQLERSAARLTKSATARRNEMFTREMRLAATGFTETSLGTYGKAKVKVFWAATQDMWRGHPNAERVSLVLKQLGVSSLDEAFRKVMDEQYEAYARAISMTSDVVPDEDLQRKVFEQRLSEAADDDRGGTPTYASVRGKVRR